MVMSRMPEEGWITRLVDLQTDTAVSSIPHYELDDAERCLHDEDTSQAAVAKSDDTGNGCDVTDIVGQTACNALSTEGGRNG